MLSTLRARLATEEVRHILSLVLGGAGLLVSILAGPQLPADPAWIAVVLCGLPILKEAAVGLFTRFDIKADLLVSLALIASVAIGECFAAGEIAFIMQLGALLEERTVARARAGIEKLVCLTPQTARRLTDRGEELIAAEVVQVGDRLRVLPGESVPVDGVIRMGQTAINQAIMTGESLPVDKLPGDEVFSGTVNQFGAFEMEATRVGADSSIQRMIRLVQSADAGKARIVGLADRWATWIVVAALTAAALTWLISGQVIRAVTILVVFCPCALVLATPTAIMAAIGNATRHNFLVREGDALERLAQVSHVAFDKTGTLTCGVPEVTGVYSLSPDWTQQAVYTCLARVECCSEHPLGRAVAEGYQKHWRIAPTPPESYEAVPGRGLRAVIDGRKVLAGNLALLNEAGLTFSPPPQAAACLDQGCTLIYLAVDGTAVGFLALADAPRERAASTVADLKQAGVTPVLLTGDHAQAAGHIALLLGISMYQADCLPEDKLAWIDRTQQNGHPVCMLGDGINDAPALKKAFVGIAMGGIGSDIAADAADIVLVNDDIRQLPHLLALSRRMMQTIRRNLAGSMLLNLIAVLLAMTGLLNPVVGALVHNAGSVLVILNSSLLLHWQSHSSAN